MRGIGIRVTPKDIYYCIIDFIQDEDYKIIDLNKLIVPKSLNRPDSLRYIRTNFLDIIREYRIETAGIKIMEGNTQRISFERIMIEGVVQELFSSSSVTKYYVGNESSIRRRLNLAKGEYKELCDGSKTYPDIENWNEIKSQEKESFLICLGNFDMEVEDVWRSNYFRRNKT